MYQKHHTKGIVISGKIEGDNSRRINIFTENFGLINAKIQGARNQSSRLRAGVQDFSLGEFSLVSGKVGWKVVSVRSQKNLYEEFRDDKNKMRIVCNILNLVRKLVSEESVSNSNHSVFSITYNFFIFLENRPSKGVLKGHPLGSNFAKASLDKQNSSRVTLGEKTSFDGDEIALAECLTLMRILYALGYMRHDPEFVVPINSFEINVGDLQTLAPRRSQIIALINESLKAT